MDKNANPVVCEKRERENDLFTSCLGLYCLTDHISGKWVDNVWRRRVFQAHLVTTPLLQVQTNMTAVGGSPVLSFNGGQDSFVSIAANLSFQPSLGFTISAWVQQDPGNEG